MIEVKVASGSNVIQLLNFKSQQEADAWMAEMPKNPSWYPPGEYQLSSRDISAELAASAQLEVDKLTRKTQLINAAANWGSLTAQQKDAVIKLVLQHLVN